MSYTKLPASTNIFEQEYKALLAHHEAALREVKETQEEQERQDQEFAEWVARRPLDQFPDEAAVKSQLAGCRQRKRLWLCERHPPLPDSACRQVADSLVKSLNQAWRDKRNRKPLWRLITLVRNMCNDTHLARKTWVQEAIQLAAEYGFTELAEILPKLRKQRDEFLAKHPCV